MRVVNLTDKSHAYENCVRANIERAMVLLTSDTGSIVTNCIRDVSIPQGCIAMGKFHREILYASLNEPIEVHPCDHPEDAKVVMVSLSYNNKKPLSPLQVDEVIELFKENCASLPIDNNYKFLLKYGRSNCVVQVIDVDAQCNIVKKLTSTTKVLTSSTFRKKNIDILTKLGPSFNFKELGIGGLDTEFERIFRRAFASRIYSSSFIKEMGISHVKGILLYGPPGTGKTLIARKISGLLSETPPKIINGPEIMSKWVGESESNIRDIFIDAENDLKKYGDDSNLHVIVFDEFDSIARKRGTVSGGVGDRIVNQLLTKIDGVDALTNILVIAMTNRIDILDEALLRPGRLEIHIPIGLPDTTGREQIFDIHTSKLRDSNRMDDVDIRKLAACTENYTGAEIESVVRVASSFALSRGMTIVEGNPKINESAVTVTMEDFGNAMVEVCPAYGRELSKYDDIEFIHDDATKKNMALGLKVFSLESKKCIGITGSACSGKTMLARELSTKNDFPYVKWLSLDMFLEYTTQSFVSYLSEIYTEARRSKHSLVVIDGLDAFLDYFSPPRVVYRALEYLLKSADVSTVTLITSRDRVEWATHTIECEHRFSLLEV